MAKYLLQEEESEIEKINRFNLHLHMKWNIWVSLEVCLEEIYEVVKDLLYMSVNCYGTRIVLHVAEEHLTKCFQGDSTCH